jgi:hypothetical protein
MHIFLFVVKRGGGRHYDFPVRNLSNISALYHTPWQRWQGLQAFSEALFTRNLKNPAIEL